MNEKLVHDFHQKMTDERLNSHHRHEHELKKLYLEILSSMASDYSEYRKHVTNFLSSLEANNLHSISYSMLLYFDLHQRFIKTRQFKLFDLSIMDYTPDKSILKKMKPIFEASYSKNNRQRLSEENFDISTLSDKDKKIISALIIHRLQADVKQLRACWEILSCHIMHFRI